MSDSTATSAPAVYGVLAEFTNADALVDATRQARLAGYSRMDGYSPYAVGEVADELGFPRSEIGAVMFIGGLCGATFGLLMQTWVSVYDYPISIGGKPFWSWPQFVPVSWALLVLTASMSGLFGLLAESLIVRVPEVGKPTVEAVTTVALGSVNAAPANFVVAAMPKTFAEVNVPVPPVVNVTPVKEFEVVPV